MKRQGMKKQTTPSAPKHTVTNEAEACEIIELALDELELLTRAFQVIDDVCKELNCSEAQGASAREESKEEILWN